MDWRRTRVGAGKLVLSVLLIGGARAAAAPAPVLRAQAQAQAPAAAVEQGRERDAAVTVKIGAQIQGQDELRGADIRVSTQDGIVTLQGMVRSEADRQRALEIARTTTGVVSVADRLVVMQK